MLLAEFSLARCQDFFLKLLGTFQVALGTQSVS
jgi:hypothetical protein